jgi:hypothetical protein
MELMTAYLKLADQVNELRNTLAQLAAPGASADEPDLDAHRVTLVKRGWSADWPVSR